MPKVIYFSVLFLFYCFFLNAQAPLQNPPDKTQFSSGEANKNSKLTYKIIPVANNTFGYDIFSDWKKLVHQPSIPAVPGNDGFKSIPDAEKVAKLVISKIKKGEMPPTVSTDELKNLKVID